MRTDTWQHRETAWAVCLVLKDVDQGLSVLDPPLDLVKLKDKKKGGKIENSSQESHCGVLLEHT